MADAYEQTPRTTALRVRDRVSYRRATAHAILDEAYHCTVSFVVDGEPRALPTLHVRLGDTLYLHGSTGSRPMLAARGDAGLPVCVSVTHLDGLVFARSQFHHSANYRAVVAHGTARLVTDDAERRAAFAALVDKVATGRAADSRPPTDRELAQTAVLALPLVEVSVKARTGGVADEPEDMALPHWAGVVPLRLTPGLPEPDAGVTAAVPSYLRPDLSPWLVPEVMTGEHVILEPLDLSHVDALFAATADDEVYRWLPTRRPTGRAAMAAVVADALHAHALGERVPWVQRSALTGEVIGSTSYHDIDPTRGSVGIGWTYIGRPWWRTGVNTEAKLLLMARAFEVLGVERVVWHTDIYNERSQRAIERLGAVREGVLRHHRQRSDGSWRDTVLYSMVASEWPAARDRLRERMAACSASPIR
jgi:RimJ/RimL family protein N-acetyltransferase/nitroimidazol reductase NimA-like FMN-containing flavoprotein (pyridoxamine 5'-phosphate oxidase superfamily)